MRASLRKVAATPVARDAAGGRAWARWVAVGVFAAGVLGTSSLTPASSRATTLADLDPGAVSFQAVAPAKAATLPAGTQVKATTTPAPAHATTTTAHPTTAPAVTAPVHPPATTTVHPIAPPPAKAATPVATKPAAATAVKVATPTVPQKLVTPPAAGKTTAAPTVTPAMRLGGLAAKTASPGTRAVAVSMRPSMTTVPASAPPMVHLEDHQTYVYDALGRRDPFQPLVGGVEYVDIDAPPDVGGMKVVGIVWGAEDKFALVEDARGNSSVLRRGDKVMNGVVEGLRRDAVLINLTVDGQSQSVTIPLTRKGDSNGK